MNHKITVITPTYNREYTLERVYQSLKNQSFQDFKWLIMDDGSTDGTKEVVERFQKENQIRINYHYQENAQLFLTMLRAYKRLDTSFFMRLDSDDELPANALKDLYENMKRVENDDNIWSVVGRVQYANKNIETGRFPENLRTKVFLMRNQFKVAGAHSGLFKTQLLDLDDIKEEDYLGKGYISNFLHMKSDNLYQTQFINNIVYTYHIDETDQTNLTKTKFNPKNAFGLAMYHYHYIKYHHQYLWSYPKPVLGNLYRYLNFSAYIKDNSVFKNVRDLPGFTTKLISCLLIPLIFINKNDSGFK